MFYILKRARVSLGRILSQLLVSHEELLSLPESFADRVALIHSLYGGGGDVLDGRYGQSAVLQHELSHFAVAPQESVVQRRVPARQEFHLSLCLPTSTFTSAFPLATGSSPLLCVLHVIGEGAVAQQQLDSVQVAIVTRPVESGPPLRTEPDAITCSNPRRGTAEWERLCGFYLLVLHVWVSIVLHENSHAGDVAPICSTLQRSPSSLVLHIHHRLNHFQPFGIHFDFEQISGSK